MRALSAWRAGARSKTASWFLLAAFAARESTFLVAEIHHVGPRLAATLRATGASTSAKKSVEGGEMRAVLYLCLLCLLGTAQADELKPRLEVRAIGQVIAAHYYDADRGQSIAEELALQADRGAFDRISNPEDLASRLTSQLRQIDRHFKVQWGESSASRRPPKSLAEQSNDSEYGVGHVERLSGNVGYIELLEAAHIDFKESAPPARAKIDAVLAQVRDAGALILDLRANRGGSPAMVGYLVSAFVSSTDDVYNRFHTRDAVFSERPEVLYPTPLLKTPLYILIGPGTASAAESLAYTLQSCGRAILVGERTAGAANPGEMFPTKSGYSVFVPTGSPRNPRTERNWEGDGVQPDIKVTASDALSRAHALARGQ